MRLGSRLLLAGSTSLSGTGPCCFRTAKTFATPCAGGRHGEIGAGHLHLEDAFLLGPLSFQTRDLLDARGIQTFRRHRGRGDQTQGGQQLPHDAPPRFRLKYSYKSSSTAAARERRDSSSRCAMAIPLTTSSIPAVSFLPCFSSFRSMSWTISAMGRRAASVISNRERSTSNVHSSPWCVYSPSNMSKRSSPGWCRY